MTSQPTEADMMERGQQPRYGQPSFSVPMDGTALLPTIAEFVGHGLTFTKCSPFKEERNGQNIQWEGGYIVSAKKSGFWPKKVEPATMEACLKYALRAVGVDDTHVYRTSRGVLIGEGLLSEVLLKPNPPEGVELSEAQGFAEVHDARDTFASALRAYLAGFESEKSWTR